MSLAPLGSRTLADQAAEAIRALIVDGRLGAGDRLVEAQIAEQLQISRGPVREAFRQLKAEGLLTEIPRRGTYVVSLTSDDVRDLLDLRAGLEARAARLLVGRTDRRVFAVLEAAALEIGAAVHTNDASAVALADFAFHETVCRLSANRRLHDVFVRYDSELRIMLRSDQERLYDIGIDVVRQHQDLVQALFNGDPDAAEAAFRDHVEETRDRLIESLVD